MTKREDQMVEHSCSTKQEPEESQDSNICSPVSEIDSAELQCKAILSSRAYMAVEDEWPS